MHDVSFVSDDEVFAINFPATLRDRPSSAYGSLSYHGKTHLRLPDSPRCHCPNAKQPHQGERRCGIPTAYGLWAFRWRGSTTGAIASANINLPRKDSGQGVSKGEVDSPEGVKTLETGHRDPNSHPRFQALQNTLICSYIQRHPC